MTEYKPLKIPRYIIRVKATNEVFETVGSDINLICAHYGFTLDQIWFVKRGSRPVAAGTKALCLSPDLPGHHYCRVDTEGKIQTKGGQK